MTVRLLVLYPFPSCATTSYPNVLTTLPRSGVYDFLSDSEAGGWINAGRAQVSSAALYDPLPKAVPSIPTQNLVAITGNYTLSTLPQPGDVPWSYVYVSDLWDGQGGVLSSDGSAWSPVRQYATFSRSGDANLTFNPLAQSPYQILTGNLTGNRTVTLNTTNGYDGTLSHYTRTATNALFTITINGTALAPQQWVSHVLDTGVWYKVASAGLI